MKVYFNVDCGHVAVRELLLCVNFQMLTYYRYNYAKIGFIYIACCEYNTEYI